MADALALPPAPEPARPRVLLVGTALAAGAGFMGIIGLIGVYLSTRADVLATGSVWLPEGSIAEITATSFIYAESNIPVRSTPGVLIYTVTGAHLAMMVIGLIYAAIMTFRTLGGEYQGRDREGITAAALFWYVTIAAYAVIWLAIYVTK
jgi:hypothetical protein